MVCKILDDSLQLGREVSLTSVELEVFQLLSELSDIRFSWNILTDGPGVSVGCIFLRLEFEADQMLLLVPELVFQNFVNDLIL